MYEISEIYMYMHVCIYIYVCVYIYIDTYIHTHIDIRSLLFETEQTVVSFKREF